MTSGAGVQDGASPMATAASTCAMARSAEASSAAWTKAMGSPAATTSPSLREAVEADAHVERIAGQAAAAAEPRR